MLEHPFSRFNGATADNHLVKQKQEVPKSDFSTFLETTVNKAERRPDETSSSDVKSSETKGDLPNDEETNDEDSAGVQGGLTEDSTASEELSTDDAVGAGFSAAKGVENAQRLGASLASRDSSSKPLGGEKEAQSQNAGKDGKSDTNAALRTDGKSWVALNSGTSADGLISSPKVSGQNPTNRIDAPIAAEMLSAMPVSSGSLQPLPGRPGLVGQTTNGSKVPSGTESDVKTLIATKEQVKIAEEDDVRVHPAASRVDSSIRHAASDAVVSQHGTAGYSSVMTMAQERSDSALKVTESMLEVEFDAEIKQQSGEGPYTTSIQELGRKAATQAMYRPENITRQIVEAIHRAADNRVEIRLNPDELGRVQIQMTTTEAGIVMSVISERPETTELLRRHIDLLAQEFEGMGYSEMEFTFNDEGASREQHSRPNHASPAESQTNTMQNQESQEATTIALTGIDIRI
ncbi:flagellar hook-length control protein FliK [Primorskyibacter marinus]|uniref:flagellar hook-length control protein FliK n=1 Tax=Primorskyibacter marinus TaxID=1977320 RepID=UPI000E301922|nr:flagellar hook-length control protein FliK [Primorskyibacter marinus]